jgi:hypothetical protein
MGSISGVNVKASQSSSGASVGRISGSTVSGHATGSGSMIDELNIVLKARTMNPPPFASPTLTAQVRKDIPVIAELRIAVERRGERMAEAEIERASHLPLPQASHPPLPPSAAKKRPLVKDLKAPPSTVGLKAPLLSAVKKQETWTLAAKSKITQEWNGKTSIKDHKNYVTEILQGHNVHKLKVHYILFLAHKDGRLIELTNDTLKTALTKGFEVSLPVKEQYKDALQKKVRELLNAKEPPVESRVGGLAGLRKGSSCTASKTGPYFGLISDQRQHKKRTVGTKVTQYNNVSEQVTEAS